MGLGNLVVLSQASMYTVAAILSFFVFVPLSANQKYFDQHCILYAEGDIVSDAKNSTDRGFRVTQWGSQAHCNFPIFIGIVTLLAGLLQTFRMGMFLYKDHDSSFLSAFLDLVSNIFITMLLFIACLDVSIGYTEWCNQLLQETGYQTCEDASFSFPEIDATDKIDGTAFSFDFGMAQFGLWASWVTWSVATLLALTKVVQYHLREHFLTSVIREKERLLQRTNSGSYTQVI